ncbi:MAG: cytochrome c oxidase subunit II [Arenicellales bacterium]|nr:cytochrome c oxidase subunit II [Arenicellales bacterium]
MMQIFSPSAAAATASYWDQMFNIWLVVAVGIYLVVALPMLYFLYRYRYRKATNELGAIEQGGHGIEVLWTVIPLIIVIYLAMQSVSFYKQQRTPPLDSLPVKVEAMMWNWSFEYPNGKKSIANLTVPVDKPVKLLMTSRDVIHALHIPEAKIMEDVVPGRITHLWFEFNEIGEYRGYCREYCGTLHFAMLATIKVVAQEEFEEWLEQ